MHGKISHSLKQMARRLERKNEITTVFCLQSGTLQLIVCVCIFEIIFVMLEVLEVVKPMKHE